jgi:hypothetical protein
LLVAAGEGSWAVDLGIMGGVIRGGRQTGGMSASFAVSEAPDAAPIWVASMGWSVDRHSCLRAGRLGWLHADRMVIGDGDVPDDYDSACAVDSLAG